MGRRRAFWRRHRQLQHRSPRLLALQMLPVRLQEKAWVQRVIGGLHWTQTGETTQLRLPNSDIIHFPGSSAYDLRMALHLYLDVAYLGQYFQRRQPAAGDCVVDIGANLGCFALPASRLVGLTGQVYCCEPSPDNLQSLERMIADNALQNVTIVRKAIGAASGDLTLHLAKHSGWHSATFDAGCGSIQVPVVTLDDLAAELSWSRLDFLKIDVEGMEAEVLRGGVETIRRHHPTIVMAGYHRAEDIELLPALLREIEPRYVCEWENNPRWTERDITAYVPGRGER